MGPEELKYLAGEVSEVVLVGFAMCEQCCGEQIVGRSDVASGSEVLDPSVDRDVIDFDAALDQEFFDFAEGQSV